jgi:hypothetical protein
MKKQFLITLVIVVIIGAGAFFGGMTYQKSNDSLKGLTGKNLTIKMQSLGLSDSGFTGGPNVNGGNRIFTTGTGGRQFGGGGFVNGSIVSADSQSITVKQTDGSTKIVYFSASTAIEKTATAPSSDLIVGSTVRANGTANTDGSVTATTIQLNPTETGIPPIQPIDTNAQ